MALLQNDNANYQNINQQQYYPYQQQYQPQMNPYQNSPPLINMNQNMIELQNYQNQAENYMPQQISNQILLPQNQEIDQLNIMAQNLGKQAFSEAKNIFGKISDEIKLTFKKQQKKLGQWMKLKAEDIIKKILTNGRKKLKRNIKDPYMCLCVKDFLDDTVDENWVKVENIAYIAIGTRAEQKLQIDKSMPQTCCIYNPWFWLKAWYLYAVQPYDRTIWFQLRTFSWWFFLLLSMFPFYGVQAFFYAGIFIMIDWQDEWQLIKYILDFKSMQFISIGIIGSIVGYIQFFSCAAMNDYNDISDGKKCVEQGPGLQVNIYSDVIGFLLSVILVWISFLMLPCSKPKGKLKDQYLRQEQYDDIKNEADCCCCTYNKARGGRLKGFLFYDIISFIVCVLIFFGIIYGDDKKQDWQVNQILYMCKTIYGLMSFTFTIFLVPSMAQLLTTAQETGYTQYGQCVPKCVEFTEEEKQRIYHKPNNTKKDYMADVNFDELIQDK